VATPNAEEIQRQALRWRLFVPVCLLGVALTTLAVVTSTALKWQGIWPAFFLEFGATILLGSLLFVVQRSFLQTVRRESRTVVEQVGARADALEQRIGDQSARIETLAQEVEIARAERHAAEDTALSAITNDATYDAVTRALWEAESRRAISESFRVRASANVAGMRLYFKLLSAVERTGGSLPFISLTPWFPDGRDVKRESWHSGEDVATVMNRIVKNLETANLDATRNAFDAQLVIENLHLSLDLAIHSLRGDLPRRLRGPLIELVDERWVLTDMGLESRTDEFFVSIDAFPDTLPRFQRPGTPEFRAPPAPDGVSEELWKTLITVARMTYMLRGRR